ncbi:hypothetical protein ALP99_101998 [Pseudomonas syringae pv. tomato]|uniref:Uncharacterized protein n=4 Tax=Pseudomonas syringae group TaxID=136849 RepID=A0A0P9I1I9_9PSED|nr:hypothetical protein PLA106_21623 [Pseudomonas amygdali pv. lachrymans str. M302278]KPW27596.1 hypothetical protein ALO87_101953 [Pseudomonas syringae pv. apii]KPW46657.1 hypothetical protein ALO86_101692 [Pseudomonas syringae pv. berberidis]KPW47752.1 hypothetical protein ALO88_102152 [Pseudomonas syringae pv. antirrhini]KPX72260.1 hypothetical protein ALO84_101737 [Pseudomonas syringae pv. maculicola]KPY93538.1 hypothetical protein ALO36_103130 [Pseudomonas syringae pv. tomato]RMM12556.1
MFRFAQSGSAIDRAKVSNFFIGNQAGKWLSTQFAVNENESD